MKAETVEIGCFKDEIIPKRDTFTEEGHGDEVAPPLAAELRLMAEWLGLDSIRVVRRGDLAAALSRAVA